MLKDTAKRPVSIEIKTAILDAHSLKKTTFEQFELCRLNWESLKSKPEFVSSLCQGIVCSHAHITQKAIARAKQHSYHKSISETSRELANSPDVMFLALHDGVIYDVHIDFQSMYRSKTQDEDKIRNEFRDPFFDWVPNIRDQIAETEGQKKEREERAAIKQAECDRASDLLAELEQKRCSAPMIYLS